MPDSKCQFKGCEVDTWPDDGAMCVLHSTIASKPRDLFTKTLAYAIEQLRRQGHAEIELFSVNFPCSEVTIDPGIFTCRTVFRDASLEKTYLRFNNGAFQHELRFVGGGLHGRISFSKCYLPSDPLSFGHVSFGQHRGECDFDFSGLEFHSGTGSVDLSHAYLGICCFESFTLDDLRRRFVFHNTSWNRRGSNLWHRVRLDEDSGTCSRLLGSPDGIAQVQSHLSREYGKFEKLFEESGEHSLSVAFHYSRMDKWRVALRLRHPVLRLMSVAYWKWALKRQNAGSVVLSVFKANPFVFLGNWISLTFFWIASGYGDRYVRAFLWLLLLMGTMSASFLLFGYSHAHDPVLGIYRHVDYDLSLSYAALANLTSKQFVSDLIDALRLSVSHLVFRPPESFHLTSMGSRTVSLAGMVLGPLQLALFVLAVRRVFRSAKD